MVVRPPPPRCVLSWVLKIVSCQTRAGLKMPNTAARSSLNTDGAPFTMVPGSSCPTPGGGCQSGYVLTPANECVSCPEHFDCTNRSHLKEAQLDLGFWRPSKSAYQAYRCHPLDSCLGGGAADAGCTAGSNLSGILCEVCPPSTRFDGVGCMACGATTSLHITLLVFVVIVLLLLPFAVVRLQRRPPDGRVVAPEARHRATLTAPRYVSPSAPF